MFMILEDPMAANESLPRPEKKPSAPRALRPIEPPPRFAVSEGAERHVGFWLVVLGIMAVLAAIALIGFGPR